MPEHTERPAEVPQAILEWIDRPSDDLLLGQKILMELARKGPVIGYNC